MTTYTAKNAKRAPARRRAAPRELPAVAAHLGMWLTIMSLFSGDIVPALTWPLRSLALVLLTAFLVQRVRGAFWRAARTTEAAR